MNPFLNTHPDAPPTRYFVGGDVVTAMACEDCDAPEGFAEISLDEYDAEVEQIRLIAQEGEKAARAEVRAEQIAALVAAGLPPGAAEILAGPEWQPLDERAAAPKKKKT